MKLGHRLGIALLLFILGGCGSHTGHTVAVSPFAGPPVDVPPPPPPEPAGTAPCPYLSEDVVARIAGVPVVEVRTSLDQPHPACYFYLDDGSERLFVNVYVGEPEIAAALVDDRVPVALADKVRFDGWEGQVNTEKAGTISAIGRTGTAIIVNTDREDPALPRKITERVIDALALNETP